MKFKYLVHIGWRQEFRFNDSEDARMFAVTAAKHRTVSSDQDIISIEIEFVGDDEPMPKPVSDPDETPGGGDDE